MIKPELLHIPIGERPAVLKSWLKDEGRRLGLITSVDGKQLITLVLDTNTNNATVWESALQETSYASLTPAIPQCHWFERTAWDLFGLIPTGHPRLKHNLLHEPYEPDFFPLRQEQNNEAHEGRRSYQHLQVSGGSLYELPVGPIHAGIIEPGHFLFSCLGEQIVNLEIRLGYVHRSVEKQLTQTHWTKCAYVAESAAGDSVAANALAHVIALESILGITIGARVEQIRNLSLEIERVAMHLADLGGLAGDIGLVGIAANFARFRGRVLGLAELLAGSRFQKAFLRPGGLRTEPSDKNLITIKNSIPSLEKQIFPVLEMFMLNQDVCQRMQNVGRVSNRLAKDFAFVGVAGRASGIKYDARSHFVGGLDQQFAPSYASHKNGGDVYSRAKIRVLEIKESLRMIAQILDNMPAAENVPKLPQTLPANQVGVAIVESHRGELIHLVFTDESGLIKRYAIKDPSLNNWTALAIAVRNNLVADFPLCNKSFSLSYSGHDL